MPVFTLDKLVPGESGKVIGVRGKGPVRRRLVDMGLTHGAVIDMVKISPLGDPVEYRLRGYHLSLRKSEARTIEVELLPGSSPCSAEDPANVGWEKPLARCKPGQRVQIVRFRGGRGFLGRIAALDLAPGTILDVVQNEFPGPLIIAIDSGNRLTLGKGMASQILVQPC